MSEQTDITISMQNSSSGTFATYSLRFVNGGGNGWSGDLTDTQMQSVASLLESIVQEQSSDSGVELDNIQVATADARNVDLPS